MARTLTIAVDSREKAPLPIPETLIAYTASGARSAFRVRTMRKTLPEADYCLVDASGEPLGLCGIERKGSLNELASCLVGPDCHRFRGENGQLARLSTTFRHPVLLLELSWADLHNQPSRVNVDPFQVRGLLLETAARFGIDIVYAGKSRGTGRRRTGELVASILLADSRNPRRN